MTRFAWSVVAAIVFTIFAISFWIADNIVVAVLGLLVAIGWATVGLREWRAKRAHAGTARRSEASDPPHTG